MIKAAMGPGGKMEYGSNNAGFFVGCCFFFDDFIEVSFFFISKSMSIRHFGNFNPFVKERDLFSYIKLDLLLI